MDILRTRATSEYVCTDKLKDKIMNVQKSQYLKTDKFILELYESCVLKFLEVNDNELISIREINMLFLKLSCD